MPSLSSLPCVAFPGLLSLGFLPWAPFAWLLSLGVSTLDSLRKVTVAGLSSLGLLMLCWLPCVDVARLLSLGSRPWDFVARLRLLGNSQLCTTALVVTQQPPVTCPSGYPPLTISDTIKAPHPCSQTTSTFKQTITACTQHTFRGTHTNNNTARRPRPQKKLLYTISRRSSIQFGIPSTRHQ